MNIELTDREASVAVRALALVAADAHADSPTAAVLAARIAGAAAEARRLVDALAERSGDWAPAPEAVAASTWRSDLDRWRYGEGDLSS